MEFSENGVISWYLKIGTIWVRCLLTQVQSPFGLVGSTTAVDNLLLEDISPFLYCAYLFSRYKLASKDNSFSFVYICIHIFDDIPSYWFSLLCCTILWMIFHPIGFLSQIQNPPVHESSSCQFQQQSDPSLSPRILISLNQKNLNKLNLILTK